MRTTNPLSPSAHSSVRHSVIPLACALAIFCLGLASASQAADQFLLVTNPGWTNSTQYSWSGAWGDHDKDGFVDLFVPNGTATWAGTNFLYHNNGNGTFTRKFADLTKAFYFGGRGGLADYDNDGFLDVAATTANTTRLFRNNGSGDFVVATNWTTASFGSPAWSDYDGHLDLVVCRGQDTAAQLRLFHNNGDGTFNRVEDVFTRPSANWIGSAWGDYDNDGFLDLFVAEQNGKNALYHNQGNTNHWIKFLLEGTASNRTAIGAKVRVKATIGGKTFWQMRENTSSGLSQGELRPNFGLGDATIIDTVRIEWPSGTVQDLQKVATHQILMVREPARLNLPRPGELRIQSWKGQQFQIETSADLKQWTPLTTVTNETGMLIFIHTPVNQSPNNFYRAR